MGMSKALLRHTDPETTFVSYLIHAVHQAGASAFVVGRPGDEQLYREVNAAGGVFVTNPGADAGQLSSLIAGLNAASVDPQVTGVLLAPVDVPLITPGTVARLIASAARSSAAIVRVTHSGRHGHPVLFKRELFDELRLADPSVGAKAVVRADPARVLDVDVDDPGVTLDVDTPADYERLFGRPIDALIR
jgi:molybdenum cofactor cytidylyltransferase